MTCRCAGAAASYAVHCREPVVAGSKPAYSLLDLEWLLGSENGLHGFATSPQRRMPNANANVDMMRLKVSILDQSLKSGF